MKNKSGFTLIEMLVCIGIIAALGVVVGLNANKIINNAREKDYKEIMKTLFEAASIYTELTDSRCNSDCLIELDDLVNVGLLDNAYYNKKNPMYIDKNFASSDEIKVYYNNGEKIIAIKCESNDGYTIRSNELDAYSNWGKC